MADNNHNMVLIQLLQLSHQKQSMTSKYLLEGLNLFEYGTNTVCVGKGHLLEDSGIRAEVPSLGMLLQMNPHTQITPTCFLDQELWLVSE